MDSNLTILKADEEYLKYERGFMNNESILRSIKIAKDAFKNGENVLKQLKKEFNLEFNEEEFIELSYDLQAGSYIKNLSMDLTKHNLYFKEISEILEKYITNDDILLDAGTGEMTTLTSILNLISLKPKSILCFDISLSRVLYGLDYYQSTAISTEIELIPFVAKLTNIPLPSKSVDFIISNHSLEPNSKNIKSILKEFERICRKKILLFEPSNPDSNKEINDRFIENGYITDLISMLKELNLKVDRMVKIENPINIMNPTYFYEISLPDTKDAYNSVGIFTVPGSDFYLSDFKDYFFSKDLGIAFPKINGIPILRMDKSIISTILNEK